MTAAAAREQWRQAVLKGLKGGPFDSLTSRTVEGLVIEPLYDTQSGAAPQAALPHAARVDGGWDARGQVAHPDPVHANAQVLEALQGGCASVLLGLDPSGQAGCAVASAADLARALDGVVLEAAPVALDAGLMGPLAAEWLSEVAKGSPGARFALHLDPLNAYAAGGVSPGPIESHIARAAEVGARLGRLHPEASLFLASGRAVHEAGGSAAQELGAMASSALAYARALAAMDMPISKAFDRIVLGVSADEDSLLSIAKVRAVREIWARITAACSAEAPAHVEARSSGRMFTAVDPWTNLLRLTSAGFAASVGGADAVVLAPFTAALGGADARARRLSRNIQLILMDESRLGQVNDPAAGSWALENLTDQLARAGWAFFQAVERAGGICATLNSGLIATEAAAVREAREAAVGEGKVKVLGVTLFPDYEASPVAVDKIDAAPFEKPVPSDVRLPGPDSRCPPLAPIRVAQVAERRIEGASR